MNDQNTPTMTHSEFEAALLDRLDGTLDHATTARMNAHAAGCASCASLLHDLTNIRAAAGKLPLLSPSRDLWTAIETRIEAPVVQLPVVHTGEHEHVIIEGTEVRVARRSTFTPTRWRLAAAATILVAATAGVTWTIAQQGVPLLMTAAQADSGFATAMNGTRKFNSVTNVSRPAVNEIYDSEIATLRTLVDERRGELDSATVAILEKNLRLIDDAIAESKAALARNPANAFLLDRLTDAYDSKLRTLRAVAAMPTRG